MRGSSRETAGSERFKHQPRRMRESANILVMASNPSLMHGTGIVSLKAILTCISHTDCLWIICIKMQLWSAQQNWMSFFSPQLMQIVSFMPFESDSKHLILLVVRHITFFLDKIFNIGSACGALMCFICGLNTSRHILITHKQCVCGNNKSSEVVKIHSHHLVWLTLSLKDRIHALRQWFIQVISCSMMVMCGDWDGQSWRSSWKYEKEHHPAANLSHTAILDVTPDHDFSATKHNCFLGEYQIHVGSSR